HTPVPDTTAPVVGVHGDVSVQTNNPSGATVAYGTPPATDDRDGSVAVTCTPPSGSLFPVGTTTVTCSATDAAGNTGHSTFNIGVYYVAPDTVPPVIAPHSNIVTFLAHATDTSVVVPYTLPTATDDRDGAVPVACVPVSGSTFGIGSTTVTCTAQDAAGNTTQSTFVVGVYPFVSQQVTLASQPDESYQCLPDESNGWRACYTGGDAFNSLTIPLGAGSGLQAGALSGVTISLDPTFASAIPANPFRISIRCFTDASYTTPCSDWVTSNTIHNNSYVLEDALQTADNKHWTADFSTTNEKNFDGSSPVTFKNNYYYQLKIEDLGVGWPMNGQDPAAVAHPQPYWVLTGITQ
ncbi:MAG TPA: HYR domain-containing protein, partial [Candidatus Paceibacterota bacterium]